MKPLRAAILLLALVSVGCFAQSTATTREKLYATAIKARAAVLNHPTLAAFEIEIEIASAIAKAKALPAGPDRLARARAALARLEATLGPLNEIPSVKLQTFLGVTAAEEDKMDDTHYHARYVGALVASLTDDADGESPRTAIPIAMIEDEYAYFDIHLDMQVRPGQRVGREIGGRYYDVWTLKTRSGEERKVYFDATAMQDSFARVLKLRGLDVEKPAR